MTKKNPVIMMIDSDPEHHLMFREGLELRASQKPEVISCYSGHEALVLLSKGEPYPDIIVLDWNLPLLNGANMLRILKLVPRYNKIPVFMFSDCTEVWAQQLCRELGCADYYLKPKKGGYSGIISKMLEKGFF